MFRRIVPVLVALTPSNLLGRSAVPGNTGLYVGQPGDGRTVGVTLRVALRAR